MPSDTDSKPPHLSIVVPLYNEQENVRPLYDSVVRGLAPTSFTYELMLVDDGSRDATFARAESLVREDGRVRVLRLRRNYGQTAAMAAGIRHARGRVIVTMDGDLQNDPADIPRLVERLDEGYDIVAGWRRDRKDDSARVAFSRLANRLISTIMGAPVNDSGCALKAFDGDLLRNLPLYGDMHRFIPAISRLAGARLAQMEVNHRPRDFGVSKYGYSRVWKVLLDIVSIRFLLNHARRPLRQHVLISVLLLLVGAGLIQHAVTASPALMLIPGALGILSMSLATFAAASGYLGFLYALYDRETTCYALLAATVHSRRGEAEGIAS
jgi:glycosyltransferase involved in cell wall biosynthesis